MDELAKRFADLAEKYGPNVANAALEAARTEAYSCLAAGALQATIGGAFVWITWWLFKKVTRDDWDELAWAGVVLSGLVAFVLLGVAAWSVIDPWTWTTINHPELWIAKKAFKL